MNFIEYMVEFRPKRQLRPKKSTHFIRGKQCYAHQHITTNILVPIHMVSRFITQKLQEVKRETGKLVNVGKCLRDQVDGV